MIVHLKVLAPMLKPLTVEVGLLALEKLPVPLTTDQVPVPMEGVLAASVAPVEHIVWADPALAVVGDLLTAKLLLVPLPQVLVGVTVMLPAVEAKLTVMLLVLVPAVIVAPVGTVQL